MKNRFNIIIDRERIKTGIKDERKLILSYLDSLKLHEDYGVEKTPWRWPRSAPGSPAEITARP